MNVQGITQPIFGKWEIEEKIGAGAFGTVFKIKRESFGKTYYSALKVIKIPQDEGEIKSLRNELGDDKSVSEYYTNFVQDFAKEIELMSELKGNSNIVSFEDHDFIQNEDGIGWTILIRMELLTPFVDYQSKNELSTEDVIKLGIDICSALESCEKKNIIHRDIKPENIFLSDDGRYELGDFGIARELEKTTGGLSKKGTYSYMAPEIYLGKPYNNTVDIYSLGIMLYKLLNHNRAPYLPEYPNPITFNDREKSLQARMRGDDMPDIKNISVSLNNIVKKACAFASKDRYQSASEMKKALIEVLRTENPIINEPSIEAELETADDDATVSPFGNSYGLNENITEEETATSSAVLDTDQTVSSVNNSKSNSFENKMSQQSQQQKKKLSKGALITIVLSSLLVIIIAVVAVVSSIGRDNPYDNYYDDDDGYYENDYYDEDTDDLQHEEYDLFSYWAGYLVFDLEVDDTYPVAILTDSDETAWLEYNDDFTMYRVVKIDSPNEKCLRWYGNSEYKGFYDLDFYPKRYELTDEEWFETSDYEISLGGWYHSFELFEDGYIDHLKSYNGDHDVDGNLDVFCDSNGEIIEQDE